MLFAREGCNITIVHLPEERDDASETKLLVEREGRKCTAMALDLTGFEAARKVVDGHMKTFGSLDILVNNAARQFFCSNVAELDMGATQFPFSFTLIIRASRSHFSDQHLTDVCHDEVLFAPHEKRCSYYQHNLCYSL